MNWVNVSYILASVLLSFVGTAVLMRVQKEKPDGLWITLIPGAGFAFFMLYSIISIYVRVSDWVDKASEEVK